MSNYTPIRLLGWNGSLNYAALSGISYPILTNQTVTASGQQSTLVGNTIFQTDGVRQIDLLVDVTGAVTGTSPTLQFEVDVDYIDDSEFISTLRVNDLGTVQSYKGATLSATGTDAITVVNNTIGDYIKVAWTVGGTSPSFAGVYAKIVFKK